MNAFDLREKHGDVIEPHCLKRASPTEILVVGDERPLGSLTSAAELQKPSSSVEVGNLRDPRTCRRRSAAGGRVERWRCMRRPTVWRAAHAVTGFSPRRPLPAR
jgi:hypothetical protein